jgi:hypothetical protein
MDYFWVAHVVTHFMAPNKQKKNIRKKGKEKIQKNQKNVGRK